VVRRSRNLGLIFLASLIAAGGRGLGVVILVVPLYLKLQLHLSNGYVTILYALLLLGSVAGPLIGGPLSDRIGRRALLLIAYPLSALTTLAVLIVTARGPWLALALAAMGLVVYVESPILQAFLADEAPMTQRDAIFSLYFAVAFGVGALWAAGVGAAIGGLGFGFVFVTMAVTYLVAGACVLRMREGTPAAAPVRR
jgi:MFS transporter, FSR family, fosmidomycin resistance protein